MTRMELHFTLCRKNKQEKRETDEMEQLKIYKSLGISEEVFAAGERLEQELMPRFLEF